MKAVSKEKAFLPWKEKIIFEAKKDEEAFFYSCFGDKIFWVNQDDRVCLSIPKSELIMIGDEIGLAWLVQQDQDKFRWNWYHYEKV